MKVDAPICPNCGGPLEIRNPTGTCDHLYYPENVPGYVSEGNMNEDVTPSEHGSSAAAAGKSREVLDGLRWAIAEIEGRTRYSNEGQRSICLARAHNALTAAEVDLVLSMSDEDVIASVGGPVAAEAIATEMREMVSRLQPAAASEADNVSTPQSTGLSAIAQERDVGKPYGWWYIDGVENGFRLNEGEDVTAHHADCAKNGVEVVPLYRHPTTSPKAISEAPISAEAVNQSPDVAEMVERLTKPIPNIGLRAAEEVFDMMCHRIRSALPHPDTKGT